MDRAWAANVVISSNLRLRLDGLPRSGQREPDDPGVAVYFEHMGDPRCIPCDRWDRVADNIAAVAAAVGALRGLDRWVNAYAVRAAFTGFAALPDLSGQAVDWRQVLQLQDVERPTRDMVDRAYRRLAGEAHPDKGGTAEQMARLNAARDAGREAVRPGGGS